MVAGVNAVIEADRRERFDVVNISLAVTQPDPALEDAVARLVALDLVVVASFRQPGEAERLVEDLARQGLRARVSRLDTGERGVWHQVRVGPYGAIADARADEARIRQMPGYGDARLITQ